MNKSKKLKISIVLFILILFAGIIFLIFSITFNSKEQQLASGKFPLLTQKEIDRLGSEFQSTDRVMSKSSITEIILESDSEVWAFSAGRRI